MNFRNRFHRNTHFLGKWRYLLPLKFNKNFLTLEWLHTWKTWIGYNFVTFHEKVGDLLLVDGFVLTRNWIILGPKYSCFLIVSLRKVHCSEIQIRCYRIKSSAAWAAMPISSTYWKHRLLLVEHHDLSPKSYNLRTTTCSDPDQVSPTEKL